MFKATVVKVELYWEVVFCLFVIFVCFHWNSLLYSTIWVSCVLKGTIRPFMYLLSVRVHVQACVCTCVYTCLICLEPADWAGLSGHRVHGSACLCLPNVHNDAWYGKHFILVPICYFSWTVCHKISESGEVPLHSVSQIFSSRFFLVPIRTTFSYNCVNDKWFRISPPHTHTLTVPESGLCLPTSPPSVAGF